MTTDDDMVITGTLRKKKVELPIKCSTVKLIDNMAERFMDGIMWCCLLISPFFGLLMVFAGFVAIVEDELSPVVTIAIIMIGFVVIIVGCAAFPIKFTCIKDEPEEKNEPEV